MRVNSGRLDLRSLNVGQPCVIITGSTSITLTHGSNLIQMGLYLKGTGPIRPLDDLMLATDEHRKGILTYWLRLNQLSPHRLYELMITGRDEEGWPGGQLTDKTPGVEHEYAQYRPDTRTMLDKLLGRKR